MNADGDGDSNGDFSFIGSPSGVTSLTGVSNLFLTLPGVNSASVIAGGSSNIFIEQSTTAIALASQVEITSGTATAGYLSITNVELDSITTTAVLQFGGSKTVAVHIGAVTYTGSASNFKLIALGAVVTP